MGSKKKRTVRTAPPPAAVLAKEETKKDLTEAKSKRDATRKKKEDKAITDRSARTQSFSFGGKESVEKFIVVLEKCADKDTDIDRIKNPAKMLVILATNMSGEAVSYKQLADRANSWMIDSFAVSTQSQAMKKLSDERPIDAFNGRGEIWKMQKGMANVCIIKGEAVENRQKHKDEDEVRTQLTTFNLIDEAYKALSPELVGALKKRFAR